MTSPRKVRKNSHIYFLKLFFLPVMAYLALPGCKTTAGIQKEKTVQLKTAEDLPLRQVVLKGPAEKNIGKLPDRIPIFVAVYKGEILIEKRLSFIGWDLNKDDEVDMLEVLDQNGKVKTRLYDFNFDGVVDKEISVFK